jgi:YVTN family beta-propeller protein
LKRTVFGVAAIAAGVLFLASCGGSSSGTSTSAPTTSQLTNRAFVSNEFTGSVQIVNATSDVLNTHSFVSGSSPQTMVVSGNKGFTMVFNAGGNVLLRVDNATEAGITTATLPGYTDSLAVTSDGTKAYAAIRNAPSTTGTPLGVVSFVDYTATTNTSVDVPLARRLVLGPSGAKLLVFSDNSNSVTVIDTATKAVTVVGGFDRPAWGVFSSDSSKAYIMNCGPECGGTTASVTELDNLGGVPALGTNTPVSAATIGLLDGSNLYVAGTVTAGTGGGRLDVLNTAGLAVTKSGVVINDGYHTTMAISNGRVFVGARACSNVAEGCLSIYNGGAGTAVIGTPKGEVTGMQAISGRMIVYVCEGGELRIYDSSTSTEKLPAPVDIVGKAWDVKTVD